MAIQYQVMNSQAAKSFTAAESNENQRRWNDDKWQSANSDEKNNYDITRRHLNFEITANREIKPCATSIGIDERIQKRFEALGRRNPNEYWKVPVNLVNKFVISGSPETMRKLAFGQQKVDFSKGSQVDNSQLQREQPIEEWALAIYDFMVKRYGKDNIVGFDVHLDESTPHAHVTIIPIAPNGKLSFKHFFGKNKWEASKIMTQLHDDLYEEVSSKFGLERGEDCHVTNAHHVDKAEYYRELSRNIKECEKRRKSLLTMVTNLASAKRNLTRQIDELEKQLKSNQGDAEQLEKKIADLKTQKQAVVDALKDKQFKLSIAEQQYKEAKEQADAMEDKLQNVTEKVAKKYNIVWQAALGSLYHAEIKNLYDSCESYEDHIWMQNHIKFGEIHNLKTSQEILDYAFRMFVTYVDGATTFAENTNGGGGGSDDDWRRRKDEDELAFANRCLMQSYQRFYPMKFSDRRSGRRR